ncbi:MAG TPA: hypothetical protein VFI91_09955 [Longimicrobiaceae bacterium]|nr:hypothetical protein [Longimicrobiaceae bacterium]
MGAARRRNFRAERTERNSFVLLQHVHTISGGNENLEMLGIKVGDQLGFDRDETDRLIRYLVEQKYLQNRSVGSLISITREGVTYLEQLAWRRRSVRGRWEEVQIELR